MHGLLCASGLARDHAFPFCPVRVCRCAATPAARLLDAPSGQAGCTTWEQLPDGRRVGLSYFQMSGLTCAACTGAIEAALQRVPGMIEARVSAGTGRASIRSDAALTCPSQLVEAVGCAGCGAVPDVDGSARTLRLHDVRHAAVHR